jgi:fermentation-respiration switch protein FrsA (DUF1100 family)
MAERLAIWLAVATATLAAQLYPPGPQVLTFLSDADDSDQPYALYLPGNFDPARKWPLVISLHGAGSNHRLNLRRVFGRGNLPGETDAEATRRWPPLPDVDFIVASPLARGTMGYQGLAEKDVYDVLADVQRRFPVDEDRVYLTGLSMGGGGALRLALTRPDVWAAVAAVCPAVPAGLERLAGNALHLPVRLFHGELDPVVPVAVSRKWHRLLLDHDVPAEYIEYPGVRHNSWDRAYQNASIFEWFKQFRRQRFPRRVRFATDAYKYRSAYWIELDGLTPGEIASIDARFPATNRLEIRTSGVDGFTLRLEGHPDYVPSRPLELTVDGQRVALPREAALSIRKLSARWEPGRYQPAAGEKRPGLEGPIGEAITGRHLYVYGTSAAGSAEEIESRRRVAAQAADWSSPRGRLLVFFRVLADNEVTEADLRSSHLILFGNRQTNLLLARLADRLPLELNPGAADYGLVYVAPAGERLVLVNSGLPFWTGAERARRAVFGFVPLIPRLLDSFGDFILFRGSLDQVVAEGRFDRNWKVPPEAAARMLATGAVKIR